MTRSTQNLTPSCDRNALKTFSSLDRNLINCTRFTKLFFASIVSSTILIGCGMVESYYAIPSSEVNGYIDRLRGGSRKSESEEVEFMLNELRFLIEHGEVLLKTEKNEKFKVKTIFRINPKLIANSKLDESLRDILGRTEIDSFENYLYIDDRNWNCGRRSDDMDRLKMVNGDLYRDGKRFIKKYQLRL